MNTIDTSPLPDKRIVDHRGEKLFRLTVIAYAGRSTSGGAQWEWECECGNRLVAKYNTVSSGRTKSCGCLSSEITSERNTVHGLSNAPEYKVWCGMITRCTNPNQKAFAHYGGRGITICERWRNDFSAFLSDMGQRPDPTYSLERVNNDGPYSPENCIWAPKKRQANNTRANHYITFNGKTQTLSEWADELGVNPRCVSNRLRRGIPLEIALTTKRLPNSNGYIKGKTKQPCTPCATP